MISPVAHASALSTNQQGTPLVVEDPAKNRLFVMSTGQTIPAGKVSLGSFEIFLLQAGYAPTEFLHFNLSYLTFFGSGASRYWSVGSKVRILSPSGAFRGLSLGADVGFFNELFVVSSNGDSKLLSVNVAASLGSERFGVHGSIAYLKPLSSYSSESDFPAFFQIGVDGLIRQYDNGGGLKFMLEAFSVASRKTISGSVLIAGFRHFGNKAVFDIGWPFAIGSGGFAAARLPFFSLCLIF